MTPMHALVLVLASLLVVSACHDANRARAPKKVRKQCFEDSECKHSRHCYKPAPDQWGFCDPGDDAGAPPGYDPAQGEPPPPLNDPNAPPPAPTVQPQPGDIQI